MIDDEDEETATPEAPAPEVPQDGTGADVVMSEPAVDAAHTSAEAAPDTDNASASANPDITNTSVSANPATDPQTSNTAV